MPTKVILTVTEGNLKGKQYSFDSRTTCIIGRAADCSVKIPSDKNHCTISRYHCLLDINPPQIRIRDLGSLHGTYVNDRLIGQRQADRTPEEMTNLLFPEYDLEQGDEIKLSHTVFQVAIEVEKEIEATLELQNPQAIKTILNAKNNAIAIQSIPDLAIAGYEILKPLGKGGFAEIYLARHLESARFQFK